MTKITLEDYKQLVETQGRRLLDGIRAVASGNLDVPLEVPEGVPVLTDLAAAIETLRDDLRERQALRERVQLIETQSRALLDVVQSVALGDLDVTVEIPEGVEELSELAVGIEMMVDDIRAMLDEQTRARAELESTQKQLTAALEEMRAIQRRYIQREWSESEIVKGGYYYAEGMEEPQPLAEEIPPEWLTVLNDAAARGTAVAAQDMTTGQFLALPISWIGETLGVLGFVRPAARAWDADEVAAVEEIIEQAGWALENQRLFDETQRARALLSKQIRELDCLNDIGRKIAESPEVPELLQWTAERLPQAMQYPEVCIATIEYGGRFYGNIEAIDMTRQMVSGLRIGNAQVGRVVVAYTEERAFLDGESALLGDVTRRLTGYIETRQLFEQTEARAAHEQALFEIAGAIGATEDIEGLLAALARVGALLRRLAPVDGLTLTMYTPGETTATFFPVPLEADSAPSDVTGTKLPLEGSASGWVITNGQPWIDSDLRRRKTFPEDADLAAQGMVSRIIVPLRFGAQLEGTLNLTSRQRNAFTQERVALLEQVANQLAQVVERIRLLQSTRAALAAEAETRRSYERREWQTYLQENRRLRQNTFVYDAGRVVLQPDFWRPEMLKSLRESRPVTTRDVQTADTSEKRVGLAIPIEMRGQIIGVLGVEDPEGTWRGSADQLALLQAVAQQLGQALESARLLEAIQRRAAREERTRRIIDNIRAASSIEEAVKRAVREIASVLNASELVARLGAEEFLAPSEEGETYE